MKDLQKASNMMAKVTSLKKKESVGTKKQRPPVSPPKLGKINKLPLKRTNVKIKVLPKKKIERKKLVVKKCDKELKKKQVKELKPVKVTKNCTGDVTKKRKLPQKKESTSDGPSPAKKLKVLSGQYESGKLVNGNAIPMLQTAKNPHILKLDLTQTQVKPVINGVSSNGTLPLSNRPPSNKPPSNKPPSNKPLINKPLINKPPICIPRKNLSNALVKKNAIPPLEDGRTEKSKQQPTKQAINKVCAIANKNASKNGVDSNNLSILVQSTKKKAVPAKAVARKNVEAVKEQKTINVPKAKSCPDQKPQCKTTIKGKTSSLQNNDKGPTTNTKVIPTNNDKGPTTNTKVIPTNHEKDKSPLIKQQVGLNSKASRLQSAKSKAIIAKPKPIVRRPKKTEEPDNSKALCLRNQTKMHPQRIASLDAMAKMHVICSTDRRIASEGPKAAATRTSDPEPRIKTNTKYQYKKEVQDGKGHVFRSQINCVKYEQSSVSNGTEKVRTFCSFSQEQEQTISKRPRGRPRLKPIIEVTEEKESFKFNEVKRKPLKSQSKEPQETCSEKKVTKSTRVQRTVTLENAPKRTRKESDKKMAGTKVLKNKVEKKSKVKVKETIRMRKTCTYQSVTTVSKELNSVMSSCSTVGVTTNIETKKTVVRDQTRTAKGDLRIEEIQEPFLPALENPLPHVSNCCNHTLHSPSHSMIPLAHSQPCQNRHHGPDRPTTSQAHCCEGFIPIHRCEIHSTEPVTFHRIVQECGCCYVAPFAPAVHDACARSKESNSCSGTPCCHMSPVRYPSYSYCHNIPASESERNCSLSSPTHQNRWCLCHEMCHSPPQQCSRASCTPCPSSPTNRQFAASLAPFDPIPLDLSVGSSMAHASEKSSEGPSRTHCQNRHYFQDRPHCQPFPHNCSCNYPCGFIPCSSCWNRNLACREEMSQTSRPSATESSQASATIPSTSMEQSSNNESSLSDLICQEIYTIHNYACSSEKQQKSPNRVSPTKKRKFAHGWNWEGEPVERMLALTNDSVPIKKLCYPALRHQEGDVIKERDCVLLKSGPRDTDLPYVAKIAAFWENDDDGEMMMSLLWYYRPEHTEQGRQSGQMEDEVFASKHRDVNSVACIEDKCFVLTFNEYCRYRSNFLMIGVGATSKRAGLIPERRSEYPRHPRLPAECVSSDMIFFCRHVYDFRQKRILKNPV